MFGYAFLWYAFILYDHLAAAYVIVGRKIPLYKYQSNSVALESISHCVLVIFASWLKILLLPYIEVYFQISRYGDYLECDIVHPYCERSSAV